MKVTRYASSMATLALCSVALLGCGKPMTVRDYVNSKLMRDDPGFQATIEAANIAQAAFNLNADTPIQEVTADSEVHAKLADMLSKSRDTYRRALSYRNGGQSSTLDAQKEGVRLIDYDKPDANHVPIPGTEISFRVAADKRQVTILAVDSARGLPVINFDGWMRAQVTREFQPFLMGDRLDVGGDIRAKIKRPGPAPSQD